MRSCIAHYQDPKTKTIDLNRQFVDIWEAKISASISTNQSTIDSNRKRGGTFAIKILLASVIENPNAVLHSVDVEEIVRFVEMKMGADAIAHVVCLQGCGNASVQIELGTSGIYLLMIWGVDIAEKFIKWVSNDDSKIVWPREFPRQPLVKGSFGIVPLAKFIHQIKKQVGDMPSSRMFGTYPYGSTPLKWIVNVHDKAVESPNLTIQLIIAALICEQFTSCMSKSLLELLQIRPPLQRSGRPHVEALETPATTTNPNIAAMSGQGSESVKETHGMGFDQLLKFKELVIGDLREQFDATNARFGIDDMFDDSLELEDLGKILLQIFNAIYDPRAMARQFKTLGFWRESFPPDGIVWKTALTRNGRILHLPEVQLPTEWTLDNDEMDAYYASGGGKEYLNLHDCVHLLNPLHYNRVPGDEFVEFPLVTIFIGSMTAVSTDSSAVNFRYYDVYYVFERIANLRKTRNRTFERMKNFVNQRFDEEIKNENEQKYSEFVKFAKFLNRVFDPHDPKGFIMVQCGGTNSGKSFMAQAISNLLHRMNGVVIGSQLDGGFVRVSHLGVRMLRIVEEFKGNLIETFHHLEANGTQLRKNNAVIDSRINLTIINSDKSHYSVEAEKTALLGLRNNYTQDVIANIESRAKQVEARIYVAPLELPESMWSELADYSRSIASFQKQINKFMWDMGVRAWNLDKPLNLQSYHLWNRADVADGNVSFYSGDTFFASYATLNYVLLKALTHKFPEEIMDPVQTNMTRVLVRELDQMINIQKMGIETPAALQSVALYNQLKEDLGKVKTTDEFLQVSKAIQAVADDYTRSVIEMRRTQGPTVHVPVDRNFNARTDEEDDPPEDYDPNAENLFDD